MVPFLIAGHIYGKDVCCARTHCGVIGNVHISDTNITCVCKGGDMPRLCVCGVVPWVFIKHHERSNVTSIFHFLGAYPGLTMCQTMRRISGWSQRTIVIMIATHSR